MAVQAGKKLAIRISTSPITSAGDGFKLNYTNTSNWDVSKDTFTITGFEDDYSATKVSLRNLTVSLSGTYDAQEQAQRILKNEDEVYVAFFNAGIDGSGEVAQFSVTSFSVSYDVAGGQEYSCELAGLSEPTDINVA